MKAYRLVPLSQECYRTSLHSPLDILKMAKPHVGEFIQFVSRINGTDYSMYVWLVTRSYIKGCYFIKKCKVCVEQKGGYRKGM